MPRLPVWSGPPEELPGVVPLEHFAVRLDDQTLAYDLTDTDDLEPPSEARTAPLTVRTARAGAGWDRSSVHGRATVWCQPLLTSGHVTLEMTWATADVEFASVVLDTGRIAAAARRTSSIIAAE